MDPEEKLLLERILHTAEENNKYLRRLYRGYVWSWVRTLLYWVLIIGIAVGALYFLQPLYNQIFESYQTVQEAIGNLGR